MVMRGCPGRSAQQGYPLGPTAIGRATRQDLEFTRTPDRTGTAILSPAQGLTRLRGARHAPSDTPGGRSSHRGRSAGTFTRSQ
jgi:hypothetical protein